MLAEKTQRFIGQNELVIEPTPPACKAGNQIYQILPEPTQPAKK
jgi:hypothetical protein